LLLRSRTEAKSEVDLPASKLWVLEENIVDFPASCIVESLYT